MSGVERRQMAASLRRAMGRQERARGVAHPSIYRACWRSASGLKKNNKKTLTKKLGG